MFDTIIKRWINNNTLFQEDIYYILLEWDKVFHKNHVNENDIAQIAQVPIWFSMEGLSILEHAIKMIGIKEGYEWIEVCDSNGQLIRRFWNNKS